jgi:hypothetical protein
MSLESFVFSSFQQKSQLLLCITVIIIFDLLFFSPKTFQKFLQLSSLPKRNQLFFLCLLLLLLV